MEIVSSSESSSSAYVIELRALLEKEWDKFANFEEEKSGIKAPPPLLAIQHGELLGGLVFSLWPSPETDLMAIWVNGLIVKPEYRRQGVASSLITAAVKNQTSLYVLTEIEDLYKNNGWRVITRSAKGVVLQHKT